MTDKKSSTDAPTLASASVSPEVKELIERARRLLSAAQPDDDHVKRVRYDHGGGRMFRAVPRGHGAPWHDDEDRTLMIDAYQEGDREFHFAAASLVRDLASALTRLQQGIEQVREELSVSVKQIACAHQSRAGGNDYLLCNDCGAMWDYRREGVFDAISASVKRVTDELLTLSQGRATP